MAIPTRLEQSARFHYRSLAQTRGLSMINAPETQRLSTTSRLVVASIGLGLLMILLAVRSLEPDPRGFGTHEQLGLTQCSFYRWTGRVCPTCGATTAWAHALRGDFTAAAHANVAGMLLCIAAAASMAWLMVSAGVGRWWIVKPNARVLLIASSAVMTIGLLDWLRRLW